MDKSKALLEFYSDKNHFLDQVLVLRELAIAAGLAETYKWQFPTYTLDGKNVLSIAAFKDWYGMWFMQGVMLRDDAKLLVNAQEGKTQAMRQMRFGKEDSIPTETVAAYILEAITNQKNGKRYKATKSQAQVQVNIPPLLQEALDKNKTLAKAFETLSAARQRGHADYIASAKQDKTKQSRLTKILPLILEGKSVDDLYNQPK